ncbi:LysE family transporter [Brevibacillus migulae]|uniref:LysE family transporter n=1 Tax=Brevibacillus migulae TaxID=1644114 RepID=UPI00106E18EC|nr:LysE family transporter [Brevibacillus migulae]
MPIFSFLLFVFVTSFTPGPNNIMALFFAHKYGLKRTVRFCLGVSAGFFVIMVLSCFFNRLLTHYMPRIEFILTIIGAAYMLYLAFLLLLSKPTGLAQHSEATNGFLTGMLLQFVNPKGILYGITVISTFILPYHSSEVKLLFFSLFLAFVGFLSTFCWSAFGSVFQRFLSTYQRPFHITMAFLLAYSAVSILIV